MDLVVQLGNEYGLSINWKKVEIMPIRGNIEITDSSGKVRETKESLSYLGATIHNSGKIDSELSRRLGLATQDFKSLRSIWNRTCLSCLEKFAIYRSCVCSKLPLDCSQRG